MPYNNPISIFTAEQIEKLNSGGNLKSLKKEILLHFQLSDEATIERNGRQLDKNQVLEIFDALQADTDLHLKIYQNKSLLAFLENKDLAFFKNTAAKKTVQQDPVYKDKIDGHIAEQLNLVTANMLSDVQFSTPDKLQDILNYTSSMDAGLQDKSYNKAYAQTKAFVDNLRLKFPEPFADSRKLELHPELDELINPLLYKCFDKLPGSFQDIGFTYAVWCHNDVVNNAFRREPAYFNFKRSALTVLSKAQEIGCHITNSSAFKDNTREVKRFLNTSSGGGRSTASSQTRSNNNTSSRHSRTYRKTEDSSSGWSAIKTVLLVLFLCFKVMYIATKCNNNNSSRYNSPVTHRQQTDIDRMIREAQNGGYGNSSGNASLQRGSLERTVNGFIGDRSTNFIKELTRSEKVNNVIELDYTTQIFPTNSEHFYQLIPDDIRNEFDGKEKDFVVKFTDPELPDVSFSHRFRIKVNAQKTYGRVIYDSKKSKNGVKEQLTIKRLLKNKPLYGTITQYKVSNREIKQQKSFEINAGEYPEPEVMEDKPIAVNFAEQKLKKWNNYKMTGVEDQRYAGIILHNFNQAAHKVLKLGNYYTLDKMITYSPNSLSTAKLKTNSIREQKAGFRYYVTSNEDNVAICSAKSKDGFYQIRYFVDRETNRMKGMTMVTLSPDALMAEVVEVFYK